MGCLEPTVIRFMHWDVNAFYYRYTADISCWSFKTLQAWPVTTKPSL